MGHLQRVWHANRGRLLLRSPGPVPLGPAYDLLVETNPFPNLSLFYRTMLFGYPSVLSRFCLLYNIYHLCFTCIDFYDLSAWGGCWFIVYIRRFIYQVLNVCPFEYSAVAGSEKVGPVNQVNHTSWVAIVTPTDRPRSIHNRSVIELFVVLLFCHFALLTFLLVLGLLS